MVMVARHCPRCLTITGHQSVEPPAPPGVAIPIRTWACMSCEHVSQVDGGDDSHESAERVA